MHDDREHEVSCCQRQIATPIDFEMDAFCLEAIDRCFERKFEAFVFALPTRNAKIDRTEVYKFST